MKKQAFTLIEMTISLALFTLALSVGLFATVGTNGLIRKAESRSVVAENGRNVEEQIERLLTDIAPAAVRLISMNGRNVAIETRRFSSVQAQAVCEFIGLARLDTTNGENFYLLSDTGTTLAYWIFVYNGNSCIPPTTRPAVSEYPLFHNTILSSTVQAKELSLAMVPYSGATTSRNLLRYKFELQLSEAARGKETEARTPTVTVLGGIPIGLLQ